jgi:hypothetical protein
MGTRISMTIPMLVPKVSSKPASVISSLIPTEVNTGIDMYWKVKMKTRTNLCKRDDS